MSSTSEVMFLGPGLSVREILTGLMSLCRKPTEWMLSMASKICRPSLSVVETLKVPWLMLRRRSAKFLPCSSIENITGVRVVVLVCDKVNQFKNKHKSSDLKLHNYIVEAVIASTANKTTNMVFP